MVKLSEEQYKVFFKHSERAQATWKGIIYYTYLSVASLLFCIVFFSINEILTGIIFAIPVIIDVGLLIKTPSLIEGKAKKDIKDKLLQDASFYSLFSQEGEEFKDYADKILLHK